MSTNLQRWRALLFAFIATACCLSGLAIAQSSTKTPPAKSPASSKDIPNVESAKQSNSTDEAAIRAADALMMKAYASRDSKQIAALFTEDAEYVDEEGNVDQGREAIEKSLSAFFEANPTSAMKMSIESIRILSPGVAVEDGTTTVTFSDNAKSIDTVYSAIHVKVNGEWRVASIRDQTVQEPRSPSVELQQLSWLIGDWVDEGDDCTIHFSCKAVDDGNFLLRQFKIIVAGQESMTGSQRIGWDPTARRFRVWTFDSLGAYSEGLWQHEGDKWLLKSNGVTSDGHSASSTSVYTCVNAHSMTWQSIHHEIDGEQLPDSPAITIVRTAPFPVSKVAADDK